MNKLLGGKVLAELIPWLGLVPCDWRQDGACFQSMNERPAGGLIGRS